MKITKISQSKIQDVDFSHLKFGTTFTDHMLICTYQQGKWGKPEIKPFQPISISPATQVLHYGQAVFEGMKAFKNEAGKVLLFRAEDNYHRFNQSAKRVCIPEIPKEIFIDGLHQLLSLDSEWVKAGDNFSLYIRPCAFGSSQWIKATMSEEYTFIIICSPTTTYYEGKMRIKIEEYYTRAAKGGTGNVKVAGNYAASFYPTALAREAGFDQVIWTDATTHQYLEEAGTMNVWVRIKDMLVTPNLSETILGGITRDCIIQLSEDLGIEVQQRPISITELKVAFQNGDLKEVFGTGTAVSVMPFASITSGDYEMELGELENSYAQLLKEKLVAIQHGKLEDSHAWTSEVMHSLAPQ